MVDEDGQKQPGGEKKTLNPAAFKPGNNAGSLSVRPSHSKKLKYAEIFKAAVSEQDVRDIAEAMIKEANDGNVKAAQFILDRCCGKVPQAIALTGAEGEPLSPITIIIQHGEVQS